jgi:hypothetical protein
MCNFDRSGFDRTATLPNGDIITVKVCVTPAPGCLSVTGEVRRPGAKHPHSCGQIHKEALQTWPDLAPLIRWHLTDDTGTPMHYIDNSITWFKDAKAGRHGLVDPHAAFIKTSVWGVLPDDGSPPWDATVYELTDRLYARLPALRAAFFADLSAFNLAFV